RPYVGRFHYARRDQEVQPFEKASLVRALVESAPGSLAGEAIAHINDRDGVKYILADNSWLLIRPSGTEPVLRVYAEAHSDAQVQALLDAGGAMAQGVLGAVAVGK
ncbi:MAG: phosphoglucomutase/phosphomannomutase family protein, partial [Caldilineae bacterium]